MMYKKRSVVWTIVLSIVLILVLLINISIFIVGPKLRYDAKISEVETKIKQEIKKDTVVYRHVFEHIAYTTQDDQFVYWFNEEGVLVTKVSTDELAMDKVDERAHELGIQDYEVHIGYGKDQPVYEIQSKEAYVLLDFNTLEVVHFR